jgi:cell division septation protein DedD
MPESRGKKVFRIQLSVSVILLLFTLSALSLFATFYLGMLAGKSMLRPPETSLEESDSLAEEPMSEEDLKFFGLGERKKDQNLFDLEGIRELKKKTEELIKVPKTTESTSPITPKADTPKVAAPKSPTSEQKVVSKKLDAAYKVTSSKSSTKTKEPGVKTKIDATYTIQVFASRNHENAKKLVKKLKKIGFEEVFIFKHTAGSKTFYRVRVGKIKRSETKNLAKKLKNLKFIDSVQITRF